MQHYVSGVDDVYSRSVNVGGYTYVNPKYRGKKIGSGIVLNINIMPKQETTHEA
jgi:hypothetical protein